MFRTVKKLLWLGFFLRMSVAVWNGFFGPSPGAGQDALWFHSVAVEYSSNLVLDNFVIGWFYTYILGVIYFLTTPSLFLGSFLSIVAWFASAFILLRIMRLLLFNKSSQYKAMLIYALLPSSIFITSVTLREPYQLLFVNLAIYATLKIYLNKSTAYWPVLFCAVISMSTLHDALFAFGIIFVIATLIMLVLRRRGRKSFSGIKLVFVVPLVVLVLMYGLLLFGIFSYTFEEGFPSAVEAYQHGLMGTEARAHYRSNVSINSGVDLLFFIPIALFQYFFEPMPWRIATAFDAGLMLENILRAWLLWKAWAVLRNMPVQGKRPVWLVFISYLVLEVIWSLGTINWGNSVRHHIPGLGLLLITAFAYVDTSFKRGRATPFIKKRLTW